ncbi:DJ-1/PfpI family protein [Roseateles violae]|uniref:DJ-1/PfpI family protein n=1 Tax=Roseateles violae TaxID=3058042 RepID=A0ABT8DVL1_9BURK|nr:DJ-1/PfpI family protein [Pelomonas sp. PFR6]MDN3922329.1 DJ-1/PfpI family protein [Pelomonas sp. PFR6]
MNIPQAPLRSVYLYVFDGFADWEPAFAIAGINSPEFQREPGRWRVQTVAVGSGVVVSAGGLSILPDRQLAALQPADAELLILPGGRGWDQGEHLDSAHKAAAFLEAGVPVAAICGATAGLARIGLLDRRRHGSNAPAYLNGLREQGYGGAEHYVDEPAVIDDEGLLITAGGMAPLEFAQAIFARLRIYREEVLQAWYQLYKTGRSQYFAQMSEAAA